VVFIETEFMNYTSLHMEITGATSGREKAGIWLKLRTNVAGRGGFHDETLKIYEPSRKKILHITICISNIKVNV